MPLHYCHLLQHAFNMVYEFRCEGQWSHRIYSENVSNFKNHSAAGPHLGKQVPQYWEGKKNNAYVQGKQFFQLC